MAQFAGLSKEDHAMTRNYVTAMDHLQYSQLPEGMVAILLTHSNLPAKHLDIRLDLHCTIEAVKEKFRTHIGTHVEHQRLILKDGGRTICEMSDNTRMLGFYSVCSGNEIHVIDTDPFSLSRGGGLTDTSLVQKYTISEESYNSRTNTIRQYIKDKRKEDPNFKLKPKSMPPSRMTEEEMGPPPGAESVEGMTVGARCEVMPGSRRGVVMFIGESPSLKPGFWVGVKFDEPVGKNDGSVKGVQLFECQQNFGAFVRGKNVKCGDYPEKDLLAEDEDEDEENEPVVAASGGGGGGGGGGGVKKGDVAVEEEEEEEETEI